jgi:DNA-binding MarR family transcriptional regulator
VSTYICNVKLEQEIKQDKFKSVYQKAGINLVYTVSMMQNRHMKMLKKFGLTIPQFNILRILRGQYPNSTTVNDLIDRMLDKSSNASRIVDKLKLKKLVNRKADDKDRRSVRVSITNSGLELLEKIDALEGEFYFGQDCLSEEEAIQLNEMLDRGRDKFTGK